MPLRARAPGCRIRSTWRSQHPLGSSCAIRSTRRRTTRCRLRLGCAGHDDHRVVRQTNRLGLAIRRSEKLPRRQESVRPNQSNEFRGEEADGVDCFTRSVIIVLHQVVEMPEFGPASPAGEMLGSSFTMAPLACDLGSRKLPRARNLSISLTRVNFLAQQYT